MDFLQGREMDTRCTIYKKTDEVYQLKLKASRMFYSEVSDSFKIQFYTQNYLFWYDTFFVILFIFWEE